MPKNLYIAAMHPRTGGVLLQRRVVDFALRLVIGEDAAALRAFCCEGLNRLGTEIDEHKISHPSGGIFEIQRPQTPLKILVTPTNEALKIADQTAQLPIAYLLFFDR